MPHRGKTFRQPPSPAPLWRPKCHICSTLAKGFANPLRRLHFGGRTVTYASPGRRSSYWDPGSPTVGLGGMAKPVTKKQQDTPNRDMSMCILFNPLVTSISTDIPESLKLEAKWYALVTCLSSCNLMSASPLTAGKKWKTCHVQHFYKQ